MTMNGVPVPPEGLDYIKGLEQWLEQYPNDALVRSKLAELQRDPRFAEPDEPDDIMPQVPELADFPVPPRTQTICRRHPHRCRGQCTHIGRVHNRRVQPPGCRRCGCPEQGQRPSSRSSLFRRGIGKRMEEELSIPGNHAGPRRSRRTGGGAIP